MSDRQFGFRPGSSTLEAILSATKDWHKSLERGNSVICVFLDLSKAFDSLPHQLVLDSLASAGVADRQEATCCFGRCFVLSH